MSTITPTVGRKVWFYESDQQREPHDATVIRVLGDGPDAVVNLDVVNPLTGAHSFWGGMIVGDEACRVPHYRWMPYQMGQAKKDAGA